MDAALGRGDPHDWCMECCGEGEPDEPLRGLARGSEYGEVVSSEEDAWLEMVLGGGRTPAGLALEHRAWAVAQEIAHQTDATWEAGMALEEDPPDLEWAAGILAKEDFEGCADVRARLAWLRMEARTLDADVVALHGEALGRCSALGDAQVLAGARKTLGTAGSAESAREGWCRWWLAQGEVQAMLGRAREGLSWASDPVASLECTRAIERRRSASDYGAAMAEAIGRCGGRQGLEALEGLASDLRGPGT